MKCAMSICRGLLASSADSSRWRRVGARRRRLYGEGEGLSRRTSRRRSPNGTGPTTGPEGAGQEAHRRMSRPTSATAARRARATARRKPPRRSAGTFRILDGQGTRSRPRNSAMTQAIALKPDGIIDRRHRRQGAAARCRASRGRRHQDRRLARRSRTPARSKASRRCSPTSPPIRSRSPRPRPASRPSSSRTAHAGVVLFTDSIYAIATAKTNAEKAAIEGCTGCKVLTVEDTPIADLANRMGQLTTSLLSKYGKDWTYSIAVNDLYYDFSAPVAAGRRHRSRQRLSRSRFRPATARFRLSSASATSNIRSRPSPSRCNLQGWISRSTK